jgi:hypothetical protein
MTEALSLTKICGGESPLLDIVFVHGLTGDSEGTWQSEDKKEFWPIWLCADLPGVAVYSLGYPCSIFVKWAKKEMDLFERATNALEQMTAIGIGKRPTAFVAHSLGGLLVKQIIRKACDAENEHWKGVCDAIKLVVFLSTPHSGASLASAIKLAVPHFTSKHIDLLSNDSGFLDDINQHYRSFANKAGGPTTVVYYEKHKTAKAVLVVTKESSDPGVKGTTPVAIDKDHISICKPSDRNDLVYSGIKLHLGHALSSCSDLQAAVASAFSSEDYSNKAENDRRTLLEKLIAANREHEYSAANNLQNRFAQNYLRLGLYTTARDRNDQLLSDVEQRFLTHIYLPLICQGRPEDEIRTALQAHIIDPIHKKYAGDGGVSASTILSALYYLTEQCHIRWDADK